MRRRAFIIGFYLLAFATAARAQQPLQPANPDDTVKKHYRGSEVVITGFPAVEGKTPAPFETINRADIQAQNTIQDIPQILAATPSALTYNYSGTDVGYGFVSVRGFDESRLSIMVNGVPQNDPEDHNVYWIDMPDLTSSTSQINVERGAGAAFYGPPAIGGSINVQTAASPYRQISFSAGDGSYNTQKYTATLNSGLLDDKYMIYAHLGETSTDGYRDDSWVNMTSYYISAVRYDSNLTIQADFYGGPIQDALNYYGVFPSVQNGPELTDPILRKNNWSENPNYERRPDEQEYFSQPHYELLTTWKLSDQITFANTFYYIHGDGYFDYDGTMPLLADPGYSNADYYRLTEPYADRYGFTALPITDTSLGNELVRGFVSGDQEGWLPRLEIMHDHGMLTVAGEFRTYRSDHWEQLLSANLMPTGLPDDYHYNEYHGGKDVASGSLSELTEISSDIHILSSLQLVAQRYLFYDQKPFYVDSATSALTNAHIDTGWTSYNFTVPLLFLNPRLGANYNLNTQASLFTSIAYTSREPRLSDYYDADFLTEPNFAPNGHGGYNFSDPLIKPEHLLDYELGGKFMLLDRPDGVSLRADLTGYYMAFTDEIVQTNNVDGFGAPIYANAERTRHYGIEASVDSRLANWISLGANVTLSSNKILQFSQYSDSGSVNGNTPIGFPDLTGAILLTLRPANGLTCIFTGRYVGKMYGDLENTALWTNNSYFVVGGTIDYHVKNLLGLSFVDFKLHLNNITNTLYAEYVDKSAGFFVGAPFNLFGQIEVGL